MSRVVLPLKYTIPIFLFILLVASAGYHFTGEFREHVETARQQVKVAAELDGTRTAGMLEHLYREGDVGGAKKVISWLGGNPDLMLGLLVNEDDRVLLSTDYANEGKGLETLVDELLFTTVTRVRRTMGRSLDLSHETDRLVAAFPVRLGANPGELRPRRIGVLLMVFDLSRPEAQAYNQALGEFVTFTLLMGVICLALLGIFQWVFTRRVDRLVAASRRLAEGDYGARSQLKGKDELANLSDSFDRMAGSIHQKAEALSKSEERYRRLVENLKKDYMFYSHGVDGVFTYVSPSVQSLLGYTPQEFMDHYARYLTDHPINREVEKYTEAAIRGEPQKPYELEIYHRDGRKIWLEVTELPVTDAKGRVLAVEGLAHDVTYRRRSEEDLKKSRDTLARAQKVAHLGNWEWDIKANTLYWSEEIYRIFGQEPDSFPATYDAFLETVHPDDRAYVKEKVNRALEKGHPYSIEHRILLPDGSERVVHEMAEVERDKTGNATRMLGTVQDITERKRAEEERMLLVTAIKQSAEAIIVTDAQGRTVYVNPAYEKNTGYNWREVNGLIPFPLRDDGEGQMPLDDVWRTLTAGKVWAGRFTNRRKDGTVFQEDMTISPVMDRSGRMVNFVCVGRDVSDVVRLQKAREFFTTATSHELRTPVTKLKLLQMLLDNLQQGEGEEGDLAKCSDLAWDIFSNLERVISATSIQSDLVSQSRLRRRPVDVEMLLRYRVEAARLESGKDNRDVTIACDPTGLPDGTAVMGDQGLLEKALEEVLSNAVKYTPDHRAVSVSAAVQDGEVVIRISDQGTGITGGGFESLFEPYYSPENVMEHTTSKYAFRGGGVGLGLAVARMIVNHHGGSIGIYSEGEEKGATVTITLPLSE